MKTPRWRLVSEQAGQDLVEYALILAFVALVGAGIYVGMNQPIRGLWTTMNTRMMNASSN